MKYDIEMCQNLGFPGVVLGGLTQKGEVNFSAIQQLMQLCEGMEVTFHRAFDRTVHAREAIEAIISLRSSESRRKKLFLLAEKQ